MKESAFLSFGHATADTVASASIAAEEALEWLRGRRELTHTLPPDEINVNDEYMYTMNDLDGYLKSGDLDHELFIHAFGRGGDLRIAKDNFWIALTNTFGKISKEATFQDFMNDSSLTRLKVASGAALLESFELSVPKLIARDPIVEWGLNSDASINFPIGLFTDHDFHSKPLLYSLDHPIPEVDGTVSIEEIPTPSVLFVGTESLQEEFVRSVIFAANRADTFSYKEALRARRISIIVIAPNGKQRGYEEHFKRLQTYGDAGLTKEMVKFVLDRKEWTFARLRSEKQPKDYPGSVDMRLHRIVIIEDLDALQAELGEVGSSPLRSLLEVPDPRVHIIATAKPDGKVAEKMRQGRRDFDWNLFGAAEDLDLLPHQFGFLDGSQNVHTLWVPKI